MNKEKQAGVKGFLAWLGTFLGCPVDDLSGKTYVRAYHERTFDELLATLKRNRRRIRPDLDRRGPLEALRAEWETSMGKLRPLLARLAATDRLIDLIVYRLYGLTEEEVAVVEGTPPPDAPPPNSANGDESGIAPSHSSGTTSGGVEAKGRIEKNTHVLRVASLLGTSSEAARQFIAEVQKASTSAPPFKLIAEVVEEMVADDHILDPARVAAQVAPRLATLRATKKASRKKAKRVLGKPRSRRGGGLTFAVNPDGTVRIIGRRIAGKG